MSEHDCIQEDKINLMYENLILLRQKDEVREKNLTKIEEKIDKIIWFMLGQTASACIALIVILLNF